MDDRPTQDTPLNKAIGELAEYRNNVPVVPPARTVPTEIQDLFENYRLSLTATLRKLYGDGP
ncbi:MAG: hypothetical protein AAFV37_09415, partial [Pseudomonadota bacterium]